MYNLPKNGNLTSIENGWKKNIDDGNFHRDETHEKLQLWATNITKPSHLRRN